jgi:hypothetical protein
MVDTPGRCRELDYCSIGQMRTLVRVPLGQPFVCPECGKPLRAPVSLNARLSRGRLIAWSVGTLGIFVLLYQCVAPTSRHHPLRLADLTKPPPPAPPPPVSPPPAAVAHPVPVPAPAPIPPPKPPVAAAQGVVLTPGQRLPAPAGSAPSGPALASHVPVGKVRMECSVDAAGVPTNCTVLKDEVPPAAPAPAAGRKLAPAAPAAAAHPVPTPVKAPVAPPAQPPPANREVSALPVEGGAPPYPSDYVRDRRRGEVAVTCIIDAGGEPSHCKVTDVLGGRRFAEATVNWLNTGAVRFAPALRNGVPVAEERHWHIAFAPR